MSNLAIVMWPDPRLREVCTPVALVDAELEQLIGDMFETMYAAPGRGLAAPQIGVMQRLFVMDATWKEDEMSPLVCINPVTKPVGVATSTNEEACLSIVGVAADVTRPNAIELSYTDMTGAQVTTYLEGFAAICAQHEMDHLEERVIFDHLDTDARAALETEYESLKI